MFFTQVHEDQASRPADSQWHGPWFKSHMKRLNVDSPDLNHFESPNVLGDDPDAAILNTPTFLENGLIDTFNFDDEQFLFSSNSLCNLQ